MNANPLSLTREGERLVPRVESLLAESLQLLDAAADENSIPCGV